MFQTLWSYHYFGKTTFITFFSAFFGYKIFNAFWILLCLQAFYLFAYIGTVFDKIFPIFFYCLPSKFFGDKNKHREKKNEQRKTVVIFSCSLFVTVISFGKTFFSTEKIIIQVAWRIPIKSTAIFLKGSEGERRGNGLATFVQNKYTKINWEQWVIDKFGWESHKNMLW